MKNNKYYAVARGKKPGIYTKWENCKKNVTGYSDALFKSFNTKEQALNYLLNNNVHVKHVKISNQNIEKKINKICILCGIPINKKGELCLSCAIKKNKISKQLNGVSTSSLLFLKDYYKTSNIFEILEKDPKKIYKVYSLSKYERQELKHSIKDYYKNNPNIKLNEIPNFVKRILGKTKSPIEVKGMRTNPQIHFHCKLCNKNFWCNYSILKKSNGHICEANMSFGEIEVEDFLKSNKIQYKTQRKTLLCINPTTGYQMPYDFEIESKKILIEVQGEQHRKYISYFHRDYSDFEYQQEKDAYKKKFAELNGYKLIEIWYEEIYDGSFKEKLLKLI